MGSDLLASLTSRLPILALILQWPSLDHDFSAVIKNHILLGLEIGPNRTVCCESGGHRL